MARRKQSRALQIEQLIRERDALAKDLATKAAAEREEREEIEAKPAVIAEHRSGELTPGGVDESEQPEGA